MIKLLLYLLCSVAVFAKETDQDTLFSTLCTATEWNIADHLAESRSIEELEKLTQKDTTLLSQVLSDLSHMDLIEEVSFGVFANTEKGAQLFRSLSRNTSWFSIVRHLLNPIVKSAGQAAFDAITMALMVEELTDTETEQELWDEYKEHTQKEKEAVRTEPNDLKEKLTLDEAKHKPWAKEDEIMKGKINDPRYPPSEWQKSQYKHKMSDGSEVEVHYWEHRVTGERRDFKFKKP